MTQQETYDGAQDSPQDSTGEGPLTGLRVLDFSRVLSGPFCGRALADLGADVIKIEPPDGDLTRYFQPRRNSVSYYFTQQNAGKRNISLDLTRPEALDLLLRMVGDADVVLENFRPGVMARMGLGYDAVAAVNPRCVYASITGYGQDGPWSDRRAYAIVIHAEMGMTRLRLAQGGEPRNEPFSHADVYAGLECVAGILAALYQRQRTGRGQHVDVAMASSLLTVNERVQEELSGIDIETGGNGIPDSPILRTASGRSITISGDPLTRGGFRTFCRLMDREDLQDDPRFAEADARRAHAPELIAIVQEWVAGFDDVHDLEAAIGKARLAMGVVRSVEEVADSEWAKHRGVIAEVDDGVDGTIRIPDAPWRFSGAHAGVAGGPAYRGEHNRQILEELGLEAAEIDALEASGVLSSRPHKRSE